MYGRGRSVCRTDRLWMLDRGCTLGTINTPFCPAICTGVMRRSCGALCLALRPIAIKCGRIWFYGLMSRQVERSNGLATSSLFLSSAHCTTNSGGYNFWKAQAATGALLHRSPFNTLGRLLFPLVRRLRIRFKDLIAERFKSKHHSRVERNASRANA
jgi:hypothetical protein